MADLDPREQQRNVERELAEVRARHARVVGQAEGTFMSTLGTDPVHRELVRAKEWLRHDPSTVAFYDGSQVTGLPEGWPPDVDDPDEVVAADVLDRKDKYLERFSLDGEEQPRSGEEPPPVTPSVARFREIVGDTT